jgi:high-affinity nickel-transport protein
MGTIMPKAAANNLSTASVRLRLIESVRVWPGLAGVAACIGLLHLAGWVTLLTVVAPQHFSAGSRVFGIGIGITAYMLGVRHAFDADHIAAIDNTTRNLMRQGKRSASVGFWFSAGHSSVVFGLTFMLAIGIRSVAEFVLHQDTELHNVAGLIGMAVSSGFLFMVALLNLVVLANIWKVVRRMRAGHQDEDALEQQLDGSGLIGRLLGPMMKLIRKPWQMYLVGLLFGLGFDTATEVALLVLTGSGAASRLPWYAILCLPILFAAGMSLFDTIDGSLMHFAYRWALVKPGRKLYYNLAITGLSVAVALMIGAIETVGLFSDLFKLEGAFWTWISTIDLNSVGFAVVGLFVATWLVALGIRSFGRVDGKWAAFRTAATDGD